MIVVIDIDDRDYRAGADRRLEIAARLVADGFDAATPADKKMFGLDPWFAEQSSKKALRKAVAAFLADLVRGLADERVQRVLAECAREHEVLGEQCDQLGSAVSGQ